VKERLGCFVLRGGEKMAAVVGARSGIFWGLRAKKTLLREGGCGGKSLKKRQNPPLSSKRGRHRGKPVSTPHHDADQKEAGKMRSEGRGSL